MHGHILTIMTFYQVGYLKKAGQLGKHLMHTTKQQSQLHQKPPQTLYQNNSDN
jgi:hypothetical protein